MSRVARLETCDKHHDPVTFSSNWCPVCSAIDDARIDQASLTNRVHDLESELEFLNEQLGKCVCSKLAAE